MPKQLHLCAYWCKHHDRAPKYVLENYRLFLLILILMLFCKKVWGKYSFQTCLQCYGLGTVNGVNLGLQSLHIIYNVLHWELTLECGGEHYYCIWRPPCGKGNKHVQCWCLLSSERYDTHDSSCSGGHYHVWDTMAFTDVIMQGNILTVGKEQIDVNEMVRHG